MWHLVTAFPMAVELASEFMQVKSKPMGFMRTRRRLHKPRPLGDFFDQGQFTRVGEPFERRMSQAAPGYFDLRKCRFCIAKDRFPPRMGVLDVKNRVLARLFDYLGEVEVERCVILAKKHHEPHRVRANLVHHLPQGYEVAGPLRHLHRLALPQQADELTELDVELNFTG